MEIVQSDLKTTSALKVTFFGQYPRVGSFSWREMFFKLVTDKPKTEIKPFVINNWMEIKLGVFILIMKLMRILFVLIIVDVIYVNKTNRLKIYPVLVFKLRVLGARSSKYFQISGKSRVYNRDLARWPPQGVSVAKECTHDTRRMGNGWSTPIVSRIQQTLLTPVGPLKHFRFVNHSHKNCTCKILIYFASENKWFTLYFSLLLPVSNYLHQRHENFPSTNASKSLKLKAPGNLKAQQHFYEILYFLFLSKLNLTGSR